VDRSQRYTDEAFNPSGAYVWTDPTCIAWAYLICEVESWLLSIYLNYLELYTEAWPSVDLVSAATRRRRMGVAQSTEC
jgi:hypothetical protein